jgi:ZIP family zinc transporter
MYPLAIGVIAFFFTMAGGALALKLRDRLHLILGFSAGAVIAVAFFDLMPEALELGSERYGTSGMLSVVALGFLVYLFFDRLLMLHQHAHEEHEARASQSHVRAGSLSLHSLLDGVGLGLAFQVSLAVGIVVALAVLTHDFSDGINTVSVIVRHGGKLKEALQWLAIDAIAPLIGVIITLFFTIRPEGLGLLLALFAGFFLYIGASDLVPESHHEHPTFWTTFMTLVGALVLFLAIHFAV